MRVYHDVLTLEQQQARHQSDVIQLLRHSIKAQHEEKRRVMTDISVQEKALPCKPRLEYTTGGQDVHMIRGTRSYMMSRYQTHEVTISGRQQTAQ